MQRFAVLLLIAASLVAGCRSNKPPPPPVIPAIAPTPEAQASDGTVSVTASPTARPSVAPTATLPPTVTPEPSLTPTAIPVRLETAADFGEDRNPLTGELVTDPAILDRRPLAIKISNAPARWVRPQSGFNEADLVFEHITEAGITRFTMVIYGKTPPDIGPIRSARLIDLEIPAMYDSALVYSGSSDGVRQKLLTSDFRPRILFANEPGYYRTGANKPIEHTLYAVPATLWDVMEGKGLGNRPVLNTTMVFDEVPPLGDKPASEITLDYRWTVVDWKYNEESGRYRRWSDGEVHNDANTGEQIQAANVIVIIANHREDSTICEQVTNGVCTHYSVEAQIWGAGPAILFRDGKRYDGTWQRINRGDMLTFYDEAGKALPLQIGNTWFQVIPTWYVDPVSVNP